MDTDTVDTLPSEVEENTVPTTKKFSRDEIRSAILNSKGEDETISVFGIQVEIRTPALEDLLQYRDAQNDDYAMARAIINNVFVPGTDERVFTDADRDVLMKSKFSKDMKKLNAAVMRVLGGDDKILEAVEDNTKSPQE